MTRTTVRPRWRSSSCCVRSARSRSSLEPGYRRPHAAWIAPREYFGRLPARSLSLPDPGSRQGVPPVAFSNAEPNYGVPDEMLHLQQGYVATVSFLDAQIGRLLDELDRLELADHTIIVFFGDHGFHLGEHGLWHKHTLFEESTRTPLIIAGPGIPAGRRCRRTVELLDVFPTLADLCGVKPPADLEGVSLRPLLEDPEAAWNRPAFTVERRSWKGRPVIGRSIRTERWRYTQWDEGREGHELYDHHADPHEHRILRTTHRWQTWCGNWPRQLQSSGATRSDVNGPSSGKSSTRTTAGSCSEGRPTILSSKEPSAGIALTFSVRAAGTRSGQRRGRTRSTRRTRKDSP